MTKFLTQESLGKVFGLLGVAMFSMAFMFGVSVTDASFSGTEIAVSDPFGPERIMAVLDVASQKYSNFLADNLINPAKADYANIADNAAWVAENSTHELASIMGIQPVEPIVAKAQGRVAGASTTRYNGGSFSIDTIYSFLAQ